MRRATATNVPVLRVFSVSESRARRWRRTPLLKLQPLPSNSAKRSGGRPPTLAPSVQHLLQTLGGPPPFMRAASSSGNAVLFCAACSPAFKLCCASAFAWSAQAVDSCQVQLETRSTIFAVGRHFVQGAPFAIPTAPGADLSDRFTVGRYYQVFQRSPASMS